VTPAQILPLFRKYEDYARKVVLLERALNILGLRLTKYLL
jgi:hypothetical protein